MTITTVYNGQTVESQQNGSPSDVYILTGTSTIVMAGAGTVFASDTGASTIYDTGLSATQHGYVGNDIVLGSGTATVLVGGLGSTIFAGSGSANIFFDAAATLVTGSNGTLNVVGNPYGAGISFTGGIASTTHDSAGTHIVTGENERVNLFAGGPQA